MYSLLYKEFRLSIHPFFLAAPFLFGLLMFIPQWLFFLVPLYFCFVSAPTIFANYKANNDQNFTALLPISKREMVKAKVGSLAILELLHITFAAIFAVVNRALYHMGNFAFDLNPAFFGFVFIMLGIFNIILFPSYYRTGYKYGLPLILSITTAVLFSITLEFLLLLSPGFGSLMENPGPIQSVMLITGIIIFAVLTFTAYWISAERFDKVDL